MKNLILTIALFSFLTSSLIAETHYESKVIERTKTGCIPGCNSTSRTEVLTEYERPNGSKYYVWEVTISCSGTGFSSCPAEMAPETNNDEFTETCGNTLFDYAVDQIALNILSGSHSVNYYNTATGETWCFKAVWSTVSGVETITVTKEFIS